MEKQIIATLEIAGHEVRLLVGQFFNGRLNILKVERVAHMGMDGYSIMSESIISEAIKKAIENASRNLGVLISQVILSVPGIHMKHLNKQIKVPINGRISHLDIKRAYQEVYRQDAPDGYVLGNVLVSRFINGGMSSRKLPIGDKAESLVCDVDCYYLKQSIIFPYVSCVEISGLGIIDIVIDDIALAKETSALEASVDRPVIAVNFNPGLVKYSLYYQGKLLSNDYVDRGMEQFTNIIKNTLRVPADVTHRLLYYNLNLNKDGLSEDPLFMWSSKAKTHTISEQEIHDLVANQMDYYLAEIVDRFSPVHNLGTPKVLLVGDVVSITGFKENVEKYANCEVESYVSTTFGVKRSSLSSAVGAFYFYKDQEVFRDHTLSSVDEVSFKAAVLQAEKNEDEESLTQKLKNMFIGR